MLYKAFISYSHASDASLASALQSGLQKFARPWYKLRAIRVFRDKTSLAVNAGLWPSIEKALEVSEYFVVLGSPAAAASPWVRREIDYWLTHRPPQTLLVVVTEGTLTWDGAAGGFDWNRTTALPSELSRAFKDEPLYLDLRWARAEEHLSIRNPRFQDAIADLAATLHNRPKDDLVGEDVRRHRSAMRLAWGAVITLAALTVAATVAAYVAVQQRNLATERLRVATSRQLAVQALSVDPQDIDLAMLLAVEANRRAKTPEAISTLQALLERASRLATIIPGPARGFAFQPDSDGLAVAMADGSIHRFDTRSFRPAGAPLPRPDARSLTLTDSALAQPAGLPMTVAPDTIKFLDVTNGAFTSTPEVTTPESIVSIAFTPSGDRLTVALQDGTVRSWNSDTQQPVGAPLKLLSGATSIAYSGDGRNLAVVFGTASGSTVQLWSVERREPVLPDLSAPTGQVYKVMVAPDASRVVWASEGYGPIVWDARLDSWLARACRIANRDLTEAEWNRFLPGERYARVCALQP